MRQALGKGIGALIPSAPSRRGTTAGTGSDEAPAAPAGTRIEDLLLEAIEVNPRQPRTHFEESALDELAKSIAE